MIGIYGILGAIAGYFLTNSVLGSLFGLFVGGFFDNTSYKFKESTQGGQGQSRAGNQGFYRQNITEQDFNLSFVLLTASVMKADGKVVKSELDFVKSFFVQQFGEFKAQGLILKLREVLKQEIRVEEVCQQIKRVMPFEVRLQLLHYLFGIAQADGHVSESETILIQRIAYNFGIGQSDFESVKGMFYKDVSSAYKILGTSPEASDSEIKKAYRKMAVQYHPDKVSSLGEEHQKAAKEKFQSVQDAYETIKKERGFS